MPAAGALQQRCPHRPRFVVPASRTTKTLRPAELTQILSTGLLGGETRLELGQIPRIIFHFPDPTSCGHLSQVNTHPLWNFQKSNPTTITRVNYLTTAKIGKEKKLSFPGASPGLVYWRMAARDGADVEPLRIALQSLDLPPEILDFVKRALPGELRDRLVKRISWHCGAHDLTLLKQTAHQRLTFHDPARQLLSADVDKAEAACVYAILEVIVRKEDRFLTQGGFKRVFENATTVPMPVESLRKVSDRLASTVGDPVLSVGGEWPLAESLHRMPLPPHVALRGELARGLCKDLDRDGVLWIHGSSGLGKTVLAQLVGHQCGGDWRIVDLRGCSSADLLYRLRATVAIVGPSHVRGIILDDLPPQFASSASLQLAVLASELGRCDGSLVVTSSKTPPPSLRQRIGSAGIVDKQVPYLTKEDVLEMVTAAGGDAQLWGDVIHTFCGAGHPQLVAARISGLKERGWPNAELTNVLDPFTTQNLELEVERERVRDRLIAELPEQPRELLYRLTLVGGRFDRELALFIAGLAPAIDRPGEVFERLVGPWIESWAAGKYGVSPLLSDAGVITLSRAQSDAIHRTIVDHLLSRKPFPGEFSIHLLIHGLASKHSKGLLWLAHAVLLCPEENKQRMANELFLLHLLGNPNEPLYPEDPIVSSFLRLAQFCTAAWLGDNQRIPAILDDLFSEVHRLEPDARARTFICLAIANVLLYRSLPVSPARWLPWLDELTSIVDEDATLRERLANQAASAAHFEGYALDQRLFMIQATAIRGISDLSDLFDALHAMAKERRSHLLSALRSPYTGLRLTVSSAWVFDHKNGKLDGREAAETFHRLAMMARTWANEDAEIECVCAEAVMLDEFADDSQSALKVLETARERFPGEPRIARQVAKIFFRRGDHAASLEAVLNIVDTFAKDEPIERAYALREAAVSAAETGRFKKSGQLFSAAYDAATEAGDVLLPMAIGLLADNAVVELEDEREKGAIALATAALRQADRIDSDAGDQQKACLILLGHTILWLLQQRTDHESKLGITYGCCSNPEPHEELLERHPPPLTLCWCNLAQLQLIVDGSRDALREFRSRVGQGNLIPLELSLQITNVSHSISALDRASFLSAVQDYVAVHTYLTKHRVHAEGPVNHEALIHDRIAPCPIIRWNEDEYRATASHAIAAYLVSSAAQRDLTEFFETATQLRLVVGGDGCNLEVFQFLENNGQLEAGKDSTFVASARTLRDHETPIAANNLFLATCNILWWLRRSPFNRELSPGLSDLIAERWTRTIDLRRASLRQPQFTVDSIRQAVEDSKRGIGKIARIVLAAEPAVDSRLPVEFREKLQLNSQE